VNTARARIVLLALAALLGAQVALAFYRCPQLAPPVAAAERMPCHDMDLDAPALCKAFAQGDTQGLDGKRSAIDPAPVALWVATLTLVLPKPAPRLRPTPRHAPLRTRPPPLWITFGRHRV